MVCVALVVPLTPRVTVQVVVPWPPVTSICSESMVIRKVPLVGKGRPVAVATFTVVVVAVRAVVTTVVSGLQLLLSP